MSDLNTKKPLSARSRRQANLLKPATRHQRRLFLENLEGRALLATITIDPTFIRTVADTAPTDGTFDALVGSLEFLRIGRSPTLNEERGIMEFDTSPIAGAIINSATLSLFHNGITLPDFTSNIAVNSFAGNGVADVSDAEANNLQGSATFSLATLGDTKFVDVKSFLQQNANGNTNFTGFNLRNTTLPATHATIEIAQGGLNAELPQLTVDYTPVDSLLTIDGSGNLVVSDHVNNADSYTIQRSGANFVITNPGVTMGTVVAGSSGSGTDTISIPAAAFAGVIVFNGGGGDDTLTVNVANALGKTVTFNGGAPTIGTGDKLVVTGGSHATGTLNHTNATDGSVVLGANTINYTGLEPVDITGTTIADLIINLPDVAGTPDDTELSLTGAGTILTVTSLNATHELDNIALAAFTTVTINARAGNDTIRVAPSMSTFNKALTINGNDGDDTVVFSASLTAPGTITVKGGTGLDTLDYSAYKVGLTNTAVNFNLTSTAVNGYSGNVKVGAGTITSFTEIDASVSNLTTTTDAVDVSGLVTPEVTLTALTPPAVGGSGFDGSVVSSAQTFKFSAVESLTAGAGLGDKITGLDTNNLWTINENGSTTSTYLSVAAARSLSFKGFSEVQGRSMSDDFLVRNNTGNANLVLKAGLGPNPNTFVVGDATNKLDGIAPLTLNGEGAISAVVINDQGSTADLNYTLTNASVGRTLGVPINLTLISTLDLNTGSGKNSFKINAVPATTIPGGTTINASTGGDTLDIEDLNPAVATLTSAAANLTGFNGNVTSGGSKFNFNGIETITAKTTAGDQLTGLAGDSIWTINEGTAVTYAATADPTRLLNFTGLDILQGGAGKDTFNVANNGVTANYSLKGGAGLDAFNFGNASKSLADLSNPISVDGEADGDTVTLNDQGHSTDINYTLTGTTIGRTGGGTVTFNNINALNLNASNGKNNIAVSGIPTAPAVAVSTTINAGTGDDTVNLGVGAATVKLNAATAFPSMTGYDGSVTSGGNTFAFTAVEAINATNGAGDVLTGMNVASTWTIDDSAANNKYESGLPTRTLRFTGFETLQGGDLVDTFNVVNNSNNSYELKGGKGLDAFNLTQNSLLITGKDISVFGEADLATLTLNDNTTNVDRNYNLTATSIERRTPMTDVLLGKVNYDAIRNLTLNATNGTNIIKVTAAPTVTGVGKSATVNGGTGSDVLDLSPLAASKVTLTGLTIAPATTGFDGNVDAVANFTGVEEIKGSTAGAADELIGLNAVSTWVVNDPVGNTYATTRTLKWSAFENLTGNAAADTYKIQNNSMSKTLTLTGNAGADKFLIGDTVNKLAGIQNLNVIGGADVGDELALNDQAEAGMNDYVITATTAADDGGMVVSHTTVEKITLNASAGANAITVIDGAFNPATTIKLVDTAGASTLAVNDAADAANNTWTISSTQVARTAPVPSLTIDYSSQATITNLSLAGGSAVDNVAVNSTKVATTVNGNDGNDIFSVGNGDLDNLLGQVTINGNLEDQLDKRTVFKGGDTPGPADIVFNAKSSPVAKGDTLTINDFSQTGVTKYAVNSTSVSRTASKSVSYSNIELLNVLAGKDESDVVITMPTAAPDLPFVVSIDGGTAAKDNRVQIKGTDAVDAITIGNATNVETNRSQFEVTSVTRLWVEGGKNADVIHNRSTVPGLLDGGYAKSTNTVEMGDQNDVIASDAPSTTTLSPVLLGGDGLDFLYTTNSSTGGTTYLVGDYFVNNNVPLTAGNPSKTSRLQVVNNPAAPVGLRDGQTGDRYVTNHTPATSLRNRVLARLDTNFNAYSGRFANLSADAIGNHLGVIEWLRGRLPLTVSAAGVTGELSKINHQVRLFVREPGSAAAPNFPNATYNPGGVSSGGSFNGGEAVEEDLAAEPIVQNPFDAGDVDGDGSVTAIDALIIINELNTNGARLLDRSATGEFGVNGGGESNLPLNFLDVNGDSSITAFDALLIINRLNDDGASIYEMPNPLEWFAESDAAEQAAADFIANQTTGGQAQSVTDEALLALLASLGEDEDDDDSSL